MGNKTTTKTGMTNNETVEATFHGKTHDEIRTMVQNLQAQHQETKTKAIQLNELTFRIEGAIEFAMSLLPQEDNNDTKNVN